MKLFLLILCALLVLFLQLGLLEAPESMVNEPPPRTPTRSTSSNRLPSAMGLLNSPLRNTKTSLLRHISSVPSSLLERISTIIKDPAAFQRVTRMLFGDPEKCQEKCTAEHGYYQTADQQAYLLVTKGAIRMRTCNCLIKEHLNSRLKNEYGKEVAKAIEKYTVVGKGEQARNALVNYAVEEYKKPIVWVKKDDPRVQYFLAEATEMSATDAETAAAAAGSAISNVIADEAEKNAKVWAMAELLRPDSGGSASQPRLAGLRSQSSFSHAAERPKVIVKLSDYKFLHEDFQSLVKLQNGEDLCNLYNTDILIDQNTLQDISGKCSGAIDAFQKLPPESQGLCINPGRLLEEGPGTIECIQGRGSPGYCGVRICKFKRKNRKGPLQLEEKWVHLEECIQHLKFEV